MSKACTMPNMSEKTCTCHSSTMPVVTVTPSTSASTPIADCVTSSTLRRSYLSAMRPEIGTSSSCGANCSAMLSPTAVASLFVSTVSTVHASAVDCIHAPTLEMRAPVNQVR